MSDTVILCLELGLIALFFAGLPAAILLYQRKWGHFQRLNWALVFLTFDLIIFGAFTRLSDSGLGCPDWPGCYGTSNPLTALAEIRLAEAAHPDGPVTVIKAWIEMIHRYLAMSLGALIFLQLFLAFRQRHNLSSHAIYASLGLLLLISLQGAFGAWTVTFKLQPIIVTSHLILALIFFGSLVWYAQQPWPHWQWQQSRRHSIMSMKLIVLGLVILLTQIFLGAWVSTNYAVLACPDFPLCKGAWLPPMDWQGGFTFWREAGQGSNGTYITAETLVAIHWAHRCFAVLALIILSWVAWQGWHLGRLHQSPLARWASALFIILLTQIGTGISNVIFQWPLVAALMHTAGAAGLVLCLVRMSYWASWSPRNLRLVATG
ncbi:COX15/CtaA family protein [Polynucleobacter sp. IMCC30063]|uniref:COX15/CtaA family protein n=1 Tax=Polynucleobacter sp. IMCC30063 TaxID=2907298 RepID=UPI001F3FFA4C|nr:COX15/CtaA family protein [Polynucleobacter sp. IMCC30063]MCE7504711.1 COX15/CtaA family protein [Polynucleobacter sp. IMCC30063]